MGWSDEVIRIQQEEDGTYIFEIKELGLVETAKTLPEARKRIVDILSDNKNPHKHPIRLAEIESEIELFKVNIIALQNEAERLNFIPNSPIQATELLEELPRLDSNLRLFEINHPLEQHLGAPVLCIGIIMTKDRDHDGDLDVAPVLHTRRIIKE